MNELHSFYLPVSNAKEQTGTPNLAAAAVPVDGSQRAEECTVNEGQGDGGPDNQPPAEVPPPSGGQGGASNNGAGLPDSSEQGDSEESASVTASNRTGRKIHEMCSYHSHTASGTERYEGKGDGLDLHIS